MSTLNKKATPWQRLRINMLRLSFLLALPVFIFSRSVWDPNSWVFNTMEIAGILLIMAGVLGRFWSILYIGGHKSRMVMQDGPYSVCRHPLYLFSTIASAGFGLMMGSLLLAVAVAVVVFVILSRTAAEEEAFLRDAFGPEYDTYAARVPRILPNLRLFRTESLIVVSLHQLRGNLMDALVFIALIPLGRVLQMLKQAELYPMFSVF